MFEGGLFPGIILYLSGFYRRHELQVRIALFFSAASMSGAFSGLLAAAIQQMDGMRGLRGWQWIFILEGLFTVCFGLLSFFILPNGPETALTLRKEHADHCKFRMQLDGNNFETEKVTLRKVFSVLQDIHVWILCAILFTNGVCLFGLAYFSPSIVQALGYDNTTTQLMTVPPYACGLVVTMIVAFIADHYRQRGLCALATCAVALVGAVLLLVGRSLGMRYAALVVFVTGIYSSSPCLISWVPNNSAGYNKRATAIAMGFISTSAGGILSTWIYPKSSAPYYNLGARFDLALVAIAMVLIVVQILLLRTLNKRKQTHRAKILEGLEHLSFDEQLERLGDRHPDYRYTY